MTNEEALAQFRTFGSALRPALVLTGCLVGGVWIGREYDSPIEGLAGGLVVASMVNGILAWNDVRKVMS